ncbi:alanine--tRNA ligase-related protein, partial [Siminovitchia fortis]|uniref:alanine--tRNA ligase-related protein n=1 Tax=Siminovitchia fortis TaxID=254758 RepID=UPI0021B478B5
MGDDDRWLVWMKRGVGRVKKYFDGREIGENRRMVNGEKWMGTNEIENVGKRGRDDRFFEMVGNFCIGDYLKKEGMEWGWEF